jgi:hypothetical protein
VGKDRVLSPKVGKTASPEDVIGEFHILVFRINLNNTHMNNEFDEVMEQRTDEELIAILGSSEGDYKPAAMEAAQRVFNKRKLPEDKIKIIKQVIEQKQEADAIRADEPLEGIYKFLAFVFPGILVLMLAGTFKADGYDRKAKELVKATLYGLGFYFGLVILILFLEFGTKGNM